MRIRLRLSNDYKAKKKVKVWIWANKSYEKNYNGEIFPPPQRGEKKTVGQKNKWT